MKIPIHLSVCLASFAFGGLIPNTATASERLSTEDRNELKKYYIFSPDLRSVLREKNPVNYFNKIYPTSLLLEEREAIVKEVGARIVGIAGDRKSAYAIVEESPVADDGLGPLLSVIRAKNDGNVWHIDLDPRLIPASGSLDY